MLEHLDPLREVLQALTIHSPSTFSWFGRRSESARQGGETGQFHLRLQWHIYTAFYCRGMAEQGWNEDPSDRKVLSEWRAKLSAANQGSGCADPGWSLVGARESTALVRKQGLTLAVGYNALIPGKTRSLTVRLPKELVGLSPGFYIAVGDKPMSDHNTFRVYWNLRADGALAFVRAGTQLLNRMGLGFQLKMVADPAQFTRCDAAVLYFSKRDRRKAYSAVHLLRERHKTLLKQLTPVFTKAIAPGVAIAEQPGGDESFGLSRSRLIAEAVLSSHERHEVHVESRLRRIADTFRRHGLNFARPYLNSGSRDIYPCLN